MSQAEAKTNLEVLKPTRKAPQRGDVFIMHLAGRGYLLGRVIRTDARIGPMVNCVLIYIFNEETPTRPQAIRENLPSSRLLVPPMLTNRLPWSKGYFETIGNRRVQSGEELPRHVFRRHINGRLYDESGAEVEAAHNVPVGEFGLQSYRTIDDAISDALAIPRVPD